MTQSSGSWPCSPSKVPASLTPLLLIDLTPVECGRSRETAKRSALSDAAGYGYCAGHSRWYWASACACSPLRRHAAGLTLANPRRGEREVGLELLERPARGGEILLSDKGYAGREFAAAAANLGVLVVRPERKDEPGVGPHLAPLRQRIESIFWTCKDLLTLERHRARTLAGLKERISRASCAWPPASASTTDWVVPAGRSSTTTPSWRGINHLGADRLLAAIDLRRRAHLLPCHKPPAREGLPGLEGDERRRFATTTWRSSFGGRSPAARPSTARARSPSTCSRAATTSSSSCPGEGRRRSGCAPCSQAFVTSGDGDGVESERALCVDPACARRAHMTNWAFRSVRAVAQLERFCDQTHDSIQSRPSGRSAARRRGPG